MCAKWQIVLVSELDLLLIGIRVQHRQNLFAMAHIGRPSVCHSASSSLLADYCHWVIGPHGLPIQLLFC